MSLSKDQIKAIADRAAARASGADMRHEPEFKLNTFICTVCKHEIVRNPTLPAKGDVCAECREQIAKRTPVAPDFMSVLELTKEVNKLFDNISRLEKPNKSE